MQGHEFEGPSLKGANHSILLEVTNSIGQITLPEGDDFLRADFTHAGHDLLIETPSGTHFVVPDYFMSEAPSALVTADGAVLGAPLLSALAGAQVSGLYAQSGPVTDPDFGEPIGQVSEAEGSVTVMRTNGAQESLATGGTIFQGDVLETGDGSNLSIIFVDDTIFTLGEDGRMVIDEMIYDPDTQTGTFNTEIVHGVFSLVSGLVAKTSPDGMIVSTPSAVIGIRGSTFMGKVNINGVESDFTLITDVDGNVGEIIISNAAGTMTLNAPGASTSVFGANSSPTVATILSQAEIQQSFGSSLSNLVEVVAQKAQQDAGKAEEEAQKATDEAEKAGEDAQEAGDKANETAKAAEKATKNADDALAKAEAEQDPAAIAEAKAQQIEAAQLKDQAAAEKVVADKALADANTLAGEAEVAQQQADQAQQFSSLADTAFSTQTQAFAQHQADQPPPDPTGDAPPDGPAGTANTADTADTVDDAPPPGDPLSGEPLPGEPLPGEPLPGEPLPDDLLGLDPLNSDPLGNDPLGNDPLSSDPFATDPFAPDPFAPDPLSTDPFAPDAFVFEPSPLDPVFAYDPPPVIDPTTPQTAANDAPIILGVQNARQGLRFDGADDYIEISDANYNNLVSGTVEAWVFVDDFSSASMIMSKQHDGVDSMGMFAIGGTGAGGQTTTTLGALTWHGSNGGGTAVSTGTITSGQWHHVAVSFSGAQVSFYIDGAFDSSVGGNFSIPNNIPGAVSAIGGLILSANHAQYQTDAFTGQISDLRIWNVERNATDIATNYDAPIVLPATQTNLIGNWPLDQIAAGVTTDVSATADHGVLGSSTPGDAAEPTIPILITTTNITMTEDTSYSGQIIASDTNGDPITYALGAGSAHGTVTVNANGKFTYVPNANFFGADSFDVLANDGQGGIDISAITVQVESVDDLIYGTSGNDTLSGSNGIDIITGGAGADILTGGAGADIFKYNSATESGVGAARDTITDFVSGTDQINIAGIVGGAGVFAYETLTSGSGATVQVIYNAGILEFDTTNDGFADMEIDIGAVSISSADFIV